MAANCWTLHPDQLPWKGEAAAEEADRKDEEPDIGQLDVFDPRRDASTQKWQTHRRTNDKCIGEKYTNESVHKWRCSMASLGWVSGQARNRRRPTSKRHLSRGRRGSARTGSRPQAPEGGDDEVHIEALEIEAGDRQVAHVTKSGKLAPAGRGKITRDSGVGGDGDAQGALAQ